MTTKQNQVLEETIILLDIKAVANLLNWSEATVRDMFANDKEFPAIKKGKSYLVEMNALKSYLNKRRVKKEE